MDYVVIAASVVIGVLVGYQWGYDIGYFDQRNDALHAQRRKWRNKQ